LPSTHDIKPHLREPAKAETSFIPCFFSQKAAVLYAEKGGFIDKKRRFQSQEMAVLETDSYFYRHQNLLSH